MYPSALQSVPFASTGVRTMLALTLSLASETLARLAHALAPSTPSASADALPRLEYHADAGAPEGALYVDGRLVGHIDGVSRL
ncbi:MAG TPA: hypothetical protein VFQ16_01480 [Burkholderiaceae bacterium]|nr:hypothetical protein [Burkholderiaceae bacterium]